MSERNGGISLKRNNLNIIFNEIKRDPLVPVVARDDKKELILNNSAIYYTNTTEILELRFKKYLVQVRDAKPTTGGRRH